MATDIFLAAQQEYEQILEDDKNLAAQSSRIQQKAADNQKRKAELLELFRLAKTIPGVKIPELTNEKTDGAEGSYKATIIAKAEMLLNVTRYLSTRSLVAMMEDMGVEVRGESIEHQIMRTSVILNKDERFKADRKLGWSLKRRRMTTEHGAGATTPPVSPH